MKKQKTPAREPAGLRGLAEERLKQRQGDGGGRSPEVDARRLLHELEVHQIELELQNEELRAARAQTEASLARYTELFDFAPIGYAMLAPGETIREMNHAGARLLERERSRLIGVSFGALLVDRDRPVFRSLLDRSLDSEKAESCEVELLREPGRAVHLRLTATELIRGDPVILLAFDDLSERKERELQLARAEAALREADHRKDEFLAVLSHELRNPLAPIRNSLFVLGKADPGSEQSRRAVAVIDRQVTHMTRLIGDLLDVTRIARGKVRLQRVRLELGDLVRRTMEDHRTSFENSGIRLESKFEGGLFWVSADSARLVQILSNLLGNAEKFTSAGGNVVVTLERDGGKAVLRVRDSGAGIAPEVVEHVFEPFTQAPQTLDRTRGGLGLGLAMVKGLVELHGGTAKMASEGPGRGAEITVTLPLDKARERSEPATRPAAGKSRRVLVIEDNTDAANSLMEALTFFGHVVQVAYDGPHGLELARTFRPEIVICDIGLPGMDGYAVARTFRAEQSLRDAYLIALSGYAQPEDLQKATEAGFERHLAKPPGLDEVARVLEEAPLERINRGAGRGSPAGPAPLH